MNVRIVLALACVMISMQNIAEIKMITTTPVASLRLGQVPYIPGKEPNREMSKLVFKQWFETLWILLKPGQRDPYQQCVLTYGEALTCTQANGDWFYVESREQEGLDYISLSVKPMKGWVQSKYVIPVDNFQQHSVVVTCKWANIKYNNGHNLIRVPMGTTLTIYDEQETTYSVLLADDTVGVINKIDTYFFDEPIQESLEDIQYKIAKQGKSLIKSNYSWGSQCALNRHYPGSPMGFDGSGFAYTAYRTCGLRIARTAQSIFLQTKRINGNELQAGDFIFFAYQDQPNLIYDVLMYNGNSRILESNPMQGVVENQDIIRLGKYMHEIQNGDALTISFYGRHFPIILYFGTYMQTINEAQVLRAAARSDRNI